MAVEQSSYPPPTALLDTPHIPTVGALSLRLTLDQGDGGGFWKGYQLNLAAQGVNHEWR
jgi:hypothetical protein